MIGIFYILAGVGLLGGVLCALEWVEQRQLARSAHDVVLDALVSDREAFDRAVSELLARNDARRSIEGQVYDWREEGVL